MGEERAVSPNSVLPDEVMIEILSRVESRNHLELRCVCKLWKSLVPAPQFLNNQLLISMSDLSELHHKVTEHFNAFKSRILNNLPVVPNSEEEDVDAEEDDADGAGVGVDAVPGADVDGADADEEEEEDADGGVADVDGADAEEEEEEEDADAEEDLEEEEDEEEQLKTNVLTQLVNLAEKEKQLMKNGKNLNNYDEQLMIIRVAKLDNILVVFRYMKSFMLNFINSLEEDRVVLKGNLETIKLKIQTLHDRFKCLESFQKIYFKGLQHC